MTNDSIPKKSKHCIICNSEYNASSSGEINCKNTIQIVTNCHSSENNSKSVVPQTVEVTKFDRQVYDIYRSFLKKIEIKYNN